MTCSPQHRAVPAPRYDVSEAEALARTRAFLELMRTRRSLREFSDRPVPFELVRNAIATAATAPSGANQQPWRFVVLSDPAIKRRFREAIEAEEYEFYHARAGDEWLQALKPIGTDWNKPFIEAAPHVIVVFEVHKGPNSPRPYFAKESVGIAVGFLLAALHQAGLATLPHSTSPMGWTNEILGRPREERPFLVIPVGYPRAGATVPDLQRKPLDEVMVHLRQADGAVLAR